MAATSATAGAEAVGLVPNQIASLVPTFDPSKDDLLTYTRKVELLVGMWPDGRWTELASRLILGSLFEASNSPDRDHEKRQEIDPKADRATWRPLGPGEFRTTIRNS